MFEIHPKMSHFYNFASEASNKKYHSFFVELGALGFNLKCLNYWIVGVLAFMRLIYWFLTYLYTNMTVRNKLQKLVSQMHCLVICLPYKSSSLAGSWFPNNSMNTKLQSALNFRMKLWRNWQIGVGNSSFWSVAWGWCRIARREHDAWWQGWILCSW